METSEKDLVLTDKELWILLVYGEYLLIENLKLMTYTKSIQFLVSIPITNSLKSIHKPAPISKDDNKKRYFIF